MSIPSVQLSDGQGIPQVGLGLWKVTDTQGFHVMFDAAVEAGYTHFDTAQAYGNEAMPGDAIKRTGLDRSQLFITTKIGVQNFGAYRTRHTFDASLKRLQTDYVDLLLLHFPVPLLRKRSWHVLEEIQKSGRAKHIGVSNFTIAHLEQMKQYSQTMPAVNQVELHVFLQQPELLDYCRQHTIVVEAYSPLAHSRSMDNRAVSQIATKHGKSYAQIMLAWCVSQGLVVLPKSVNPVRVAENIDIFDFRLDADDLTLLAAQNSNLRTCWNPTRIP
jgi:2,5-diketo-D-gluconate reductase A